MPTRSVASNQRRDSPDPATFVGRARPTRFASSPKSSTATPLSSTTSSHRPNSSYREVARSYGDRPHRGDPRHLRQNAHSQEGKAQVELAQLRYGCPDSWFRRSPFATGRSHRHARPGRNATRDRPPPHPAAHPQTRDDLKHVRRQPFDAVQGPPPQRQPVGVDRRLHQRRQVDMLNRLTNAGVLVENRLFATLDATTRRFAAARWRDCVRLRHRRVREQAAASNSSRPSNRRSMSWSTPTS